MLLEAKSRGLVPAVKPVIDDLRNIAGFYISPELLAEALNKAGES